MAEGTAKFVQTKVFTGEVLEHYQTLDSGQGVLWIETRELDLGTERDQKFLDVLWLTFDQIPSGLNVRLSHRDSLSETPTEVELKMYGVQAFPGITTRYLTIRIYDTQPLVKWKLTQIDLYGMNEGGFFL